MNSCTFFFASSSFNSVYITSSNHPKSVEGRVKLAAEKKDVKLNHSTVQIVKVVKEKQNNKVEKEDNIIGKVIFLLNRISECQMEVFAESLR